MLFRTILSLISISCLDPGPQKSYAKAPAPRSVIRKCYGGGVGVMKVEGHALRTGHGCLTHASSPLPKSVTVTQSAAL